MLDIIYGHDQIIRVDRKVKVTDPVTVIKEGMSVKLVMPKAVVTGTKATPFVFVLTTGDTLVIAVDGAAADTVTFDAGSTTIADTITKINDTFAGLASNDGNDRVKLTAAASIDIKASSTALTILGLTAGFTNVTANDAEIVLTGPVAGREDFVWWAFTSANDVNDDRSDFHATSQITLIRGVFIGETDQYVTGGTYAVGTKLASENGLLFNGAAATQVSTTVDAPGVTTGDVIIPVVSSAGMYADDPIVFDAAGTPEYGTILTVDSATQVTLTAGVGADYIATKTFGTVRANDTIIARALGAPVAGKLQFIALPMAAII